MINKIKLNKSLKRFLFVGICAFSVEYGTFYFLYYAIHQKLILANSISFILGLLTSFIFNRIWTFTLNKGNKSYKKGIKHQFSYYTILSIVNLILTNLIVEGLTLISINPRFGKLIAMVTTSLWNYTLFKYIIFNHKSQEVILN